MTDIQKKRRKEFSNKLKEGKRGYDFRQLSINNGINESYDSEYFKCIVTGKAILFCDGVLHTIDTAKKENNINVLVASNKEKNY